MFAHVEFLPSFSQNLWQLAQLENHPNVFVLEDFSTGQLLLGLVAGVVMALAFQLFLTNFLVAVVAAPGDLPDIGDDDDDESLYETARGLETKVGLGVLITSTIALFAASYLAVKFTLVPDALFGAIVGVTIWAIYFATIYVLGSSAIGSLLGGIISTVGAGMKGMMGTAAGAIGATAAKNQAVSTVEDITAAVRRELTAGIDPDSVRETLQGALGTIKAPDLDVDKIGSQFESLIKNADLKDLTSSNLKIDRQTFVDLIGDRTDLSKQDINQIVDRLESTWNQATKQGNKSDVPTQVRDLLSSVTPENLNPDELTAKLQQLVKSGDNGGSLTNQALQYGLSAVMNKVLENTNLSDLDVEKLGTQVNKIKTAVLGDKPEASSSESGGGGTATATANPSYSHVRTDVENYLLFSPAWKLYQANLKDEFKDVIYDPEADPNAIRQELAPIDRDYIIQTLSLRDDLQPESIQNIANYLDEAKSEILDSTRVPDEVAYNALDLQQQSQQLRDRVTSYLRDTNKEELNPEGIERDFKALFEDPKAGIEALRDRLSQFDRDTLVQLLTQRGDLDEEQVNSTLDRIESVRQNVLNAPRQLSEQAQAQYDKTIQSIEQYLRDTNLEELDPDGIKADLQKLLDDPQAGANALRERLAHVDRETLVKLLTQQGNLSEEQINNYVDRLQSAIQSIVKAPRRLASRARQQVSDFQTNLENYLRNTNKDELNPDGIERDLQLLLQDPRAGFSSLGDRVSHFNRDTFVALLAQRGDLSEEEANQIADRVESSYKSIVDRFQQIQQTLQSSVDNLLGKVREYLNSLDRPELNYEGLQADLSKLFSDPQTGIEALGDRFSQFDRDTVVALLASREDISAADAERIVSQIESTRDRAIRQAENVRTEVKNRYRAVKREAKLRARETQKIAAGAAWWLFGTALTSLVASAFAGTIAINGFYGIL